MTSARTRTNELVCEGVLPRYQSLIVVEMCSQTKSRYDEVVTKGGKSGCAYQSSDCHKTLLVSTSLMFIEMLLKQKKEVPTTHDISLA